MKLTIKDYISLQRNICAFSEGHLQFLAIDGLPGVGKSTEAEKACPEARRLNGTLTAFEFYRELYRYRDEDFLLDDIDGFCRDRNLVRIAKCLCDTRPNKTIAWHSAASQLDSEGIPREFETKSRAIIIANDWKLWNQNVGALQDRGLVIHFKPSPEEVHAQVDSWAPDRDVYDFIGRHLHLIPEPSMRHYVEGADLKKAGLDWEQALLETWNVDPRVRVLLRLLGDTCLQPADRVETFKRETGASRRTFFYLQSQIRKARGGNPCTPAPAEPHLWRKSISATTLETQQTTDQSEVVKVRNQ